MSNFSNLKKSLLSCAIKIQSHMEKLLDANQYNSAILEAMSYSVLASGKRIRPFLLFASADIFGVSLSKCLNVASAIEFIHVYSLIHDDLPAMDNDDFRRGQLSNHKKFNEATAILAGDALLTYAFEILSHPNTNPDAHIRCELIQIIAKASGFLGMVGGQMLDIQNKNNITIEEIINLHRLKTGELFMASAECGAIMGRANLQEKQAIKHYAKDLGIAFQIQDDILDYLGTKLGKTNLDETNNNSQETSIVNIIGLDSAKQHLQFLKQQTNEHLQIFGDKASILCQLTNFVLHIV
jgi:farnesyl diphosphate synthase